MPNNLNQTVIEEYTKEYLTNVAFHSDRRRNNFITNCADNGREYLCKHNPCCHACYFASADQRDFEDTLAMMIGPNTLSLTELEATCNKYKITTSLEDRMKHFLMSPKYQVIVDTIMVFDGSKLMTLSIDYSTPALQAIISVGWSAKYENHAKIHGRNVISFIKKNQKSIFDTRGASLCSNTCDGVTFRQESMRVPDLTHGFTGGSLITISRGSSPTESPPNKYNKSGEEVYLRSAMRSPTQDFDRGQIVKSHGKRKKKAAFDVSVIQNSESRPIPRQQTGRILGGYVSSDADSRDTDNYHAGPSTEVAVPLVDLADSGPMDQLPLLPQETGKSIGGSKIHKGPFKFKHT
jgi:hypothetical protein